ncbi:MAG: efflux RND transporter permease subunit, partial [Methylobacteriaceae bacterium]|nr:efflux RND transporter permease subunit [Methylobacteriaceae bacterium]
AIVEIENIHRRIERHEPPLLAAFDGARQIGFAVIATTATLIAVFLPMAFMTDMLGRLFREFAIMLAGSIFFSCVVARTLTPMMCSQLMKPVHGRIHRMTEPFFEGMNNGYRRMLSFAMRVPLVVLGIGFLVCLGAVQLFLAIPKEFVPKEDRGFVIVRLTAPEGATLDYTRDRLWEVAKVVKPYVDKGIITTTFMEVSNGWQRPSPVNTGSYNVILAPWDQRTMTQQDVVDELIAKLGTLPGARLDVIGRPSMGAGFGQPIQFVIGGPDFETLRGWRDILIEEAEKTGKFHTLISDYQENQPNIRINIDRSKAADMGVSVTNIGRTMELMFGETEISTFVSRGEEYQVIMRARPEDRETPNDLSNTFVRSDSGRLVPLSSFVTITESASPQTLRRKGRVRAITIQGSLAPGVSMGEGLETLRQIVRTELPAETIVSYGGQSRQFMESSNTIYVTFGLSLLVVFLVLAAQFESWINPFIIMLTVPLALTGGMAALLLTGKSLNIYSEIGLILLIGLMAKNGILIVEFSSQLRQQGKETLEAVIEASVLRLRPILMTSIAMLGAAFPLAFSVGAGAESRSAIGTVIMGGIVLSTSFTVFVVPAMYLLIGGRSRPPNYMAQLIDKLRERQNRHVAEPAE